MNLELIKWMDLGDAILSFVRNVLTTDDEKKSFLVKGFSMQCRGEITQRKKIHVFIIADQDLESSQIASDVAEALIFSENQWKKENKVDDEDAGLGGFNVGGYSNRRPRIELRLFNSYTQEYMPPTVLDHPNDIPGKEEVTKLMIDYESKRPK